jgi:hypothetical protein
VGKAFSSLIFIAKTHSAHSHRPHRPWKWLRRRRKKKTLQTYKKSALFVSPPLILLFFPLSPSFLEGCGLNEERSFFRRCVVLPHISIRAIIAGVTPTQSAFVAHHHAPHHTTADQRPA